MAIRTELCIVCSVGYRSFSTFSFIRLSFKQFLSCMVTTTYNQLHTATVEQGKCNKKVIWLRIYLFIVCGFSKAIILRTTSLYLLMNSISKRQFFFILFFGDLPSL